MSDDVEALLNQVTHSSRRLRLAMAVTAVLCILVAAGAAFDDSLWQSGAGWRAAGAALLVVFTAMAGLAGYSAFWGQRQHVEKLRRLLATEPNRIRSIRLLVARSAPLPSWSSDDGRAARGLHVLVDGDTGASWVLPVPSRQEAVKAVAMLARRCPQAIVEPPELVTGR